MATQKGQAEKDHGNSAFKAGDFPAAIGHYTAAIVADPTNPTYPLNRAAAYLKLAKNQDAERDCSRVLALDAQNVKAMFRRGQARVRLQKLADARDDFQRALQIDPANDAARAELQKVEEALRTQSEQKQNRQPADISAPPLAPTSSTPTPPPRSKPKRRRVPIEIVDVSAPSSTSPSVRSPTSTATKNDAGPSGLLKPVSSRPLVSSPQATPASEMSAQSKTFQAAKEARTAVRPQGVRGGIFRPDGKHTIFGENQGEAPTTITTVPEASSSGTTLTPTTHASAAEAHAERSSTPSRLNVARRRAPLTLFDFSREWVKCPTPEDRWALLKEVSPTELPSLFQSSLEAPLLAGIVGTLHDLLRTEDLVDQGEREHMRQYMIGLTKVKRFGTVVLFMSGAEQEEVREVWAALGDGDQAAAAAWGLST